MAAPEPTWPQEENNPTVISPFENTQAIPPTSSNRGGKWLLISSLSLLVLGLIGLGSFLAYSYLTDPYRTLEEFPIASYYDSHGALAGSKFKARLTVVANLGWKPDEGKLMVFSLADDARPLAVLVAPEEASIAFQKGQTYLAELNVREGGLIHAHSFRKE